MSDTIQQIAARKWWESLTVEERETLSRLHYGYTPVVLHKEEIEQLYVKEHPGKSPTELERDMQERKEGEYTKGEWMIERHEENSRYFGNITSKLGIGERGFMNIRTIAILLKYAGEEEMQANAELIASAPKLKEQNTVLVESIESMNAEYLKLKGENEKLRELEKSFYMDICRAYNAGKRNMQDVMKVKGNPFISSDDYFKREFPNFKTNVP